MESLYRPRALAYEQHLFAKKFSRHVGVRFRELLIHPHANHMHKWMGVHLDMTDVNPCVREHGLAFEGMKHRVRVPARNQRPSNTAASTEMRSNRHTPGGRRCEPLGDGISSREALDFMSHSITSLSALQRLRVERATPAIRAPEQQLYASAQVPDGTQLRETSRYATHTIGLFRMTDPLL